MPLATEALSALPRIDGFNPTCHVATWYWAAQAAQRAGLCGAKSTRKTIDNVFAMAPRAAQEAILHIAEAAATWNFNQFPSMPPAGSVLVWPEGGTHSAVVTGDNLLHGYNQGAQLNNVDMARSGHTSGTRENINVGMRVVKVIPEATIVAEAARLNL